MRYSVQRAYLNRHFPAPPPTYLLSLISTIRYRVTKVVVLCAWDDCPVFAPSSIHLSIILEGSGAHTASYQMGMGEHFPRG
jgi:hypothetical protein